MKVAELQQSLAHVVAFARSAGAPEKFAAELDRAVQCFDPFKDKTLVEFSEFLRRADEYDRTGKLEAPPRATRGTRAAKAPALTTDDAARIYLDLLARATDPALTYADIDAKIQLLEKLTVKQLLEVAAKVNVTTPSKPKKEVIGELTRRIKELKVSDERNQFQFGETG